MMQYSISRYLNVREAYFPSFSADGRRIAFLSNITGVPQVWQVDLTDGKKGEKPTWPDQLTFETGRLIGVWCSPLAGDNRLIYARDTSGDENAQFVLLFTDTFAEIPLTAGYEHAMHLFGAWSAAGDQILFAANRRDPGLFDLYLQPLQGEAAIIWQSDEPGWLRSLKFSPDTRHALVCRVTSHFQHELFEIDLSTGVSRPINVSSENTRYDAVCYAADGRSVFINTDLQSDFLYIARLDLETLSVETVVSTTWDIELLTSSPDGHYLAYAMNADGKHILYLLDLRTGHSYVAPEFAPTPGILQGSADISDTCIVFAPDSSALAFSFTSITYTTDIFIWNVASHLIHTATRSSHGGLRPDELVTPQLVHYPTFDDLRIPAWFYRPAPNATKAAPVVVIVHGGPEWQVRSSFDFFAQYLVHNGYAVFSPNVRGSTGYGKKYSQLDNAERRMDAVADLAYAVYWLRGQSNIDGSHVALYGHSYGGFLVLAALTTYPDLWAAGIEVAGISNMVTFLENTSAYRRKHREAEYGSLADRRAFLESIAPLKHVDKINAPLMIIHGTSDPRVPLNEAMQLVAALKIRGVPVQFLLFDDEGHGLVNLKNKLVAYPAMIDFLTTSLSR